MDEAYNELYQQFLLLRSICLRQAALLQQLTTALQKQQGASVADRDVSDMSSIPVQCTNEIPGCCSEKPKLPTPGGPDPAALYGTDRLSRNAATDSGLLAENMSQLSVDVTCQRKQDGKMEKMNPFAFTSDSSRCHGASSSQPKTHHPAKDRALNNMKMPMTYSPSLVSDPLLRSGGPLMSEIALQSHVCEFCQAVFPGNTTTRGEFLQHLCTHVT